MCSIQNFEKRHGKNSASDHAYILLNAAHHKKSKCIAAEWRIHYCIKPAKLNKEQLMILPEYIVLPRTSLLFDSIVPINCSRPIAEQKTRSYNFAKMLCRQDKLGAHVDSGSLSFSDLLYYFLNPARAYPDKRAYLLSKQRCRNKRHF